MYLKLKYIYTHILAGLAPCYILVELLVNTSVFRANAERILKEELKPHVIYTSAFHITISSQI